MSRVILLAAISLLWLACDSDEETSRTWDAQFILAGATHPVISSSGTSDRFLYYVEGQAGGLFLHHEDGAAERVTPEGTTARRDAVWAEDGEHFAFSIPGQSGSGDAGIYLRTPSTSSLQLWDRGSDPSFSPDGSYLVVSGPQAEPENSGVWRIDLVTFQRVRLRDVGVKPKVSPDGQKIAYLFPLASSNGATLYVDDDVRGLYVTNYAWLPATTEIIYETASNQISEVLPQTIYRVGPNDALPGQTVLQSATNLCAVESDVLLNLVNADVLGALVLRAGRKTITLSDSLWRASATSTSVILASGPSGISKLIER